MTGAAQGVQGGDGGWIIGGDHDDTTCLNGTGEMELEKLNHGGRAADIPHGLTGQDRPVELTGGGMPSKSGDEDGYSGTISAPACY